MNKVIYKLDTLQVIAFCRLGQDAQRVANNYTNVGIAELNQDIPPASNWTPTKIDLSTGLLVEI